MEKTDEAIGIDKHNIRRIFYSGFMTSLILLTIVLSFDYSMGLRIEFADKVEQLSTGIINEKKRFLRNAVDRTIQYIESERTHTREEFTSKNLTQTEIESIAIGRITQHIRNLRLIGNGYVWVNHIVNYEGGDRYAIRKIHPNLPDTEGQWLSTNMTDKFGNHPYQAELDGIKKEGELFFQYYFKEMGSEKVSHKMSFAKLYKPFDWVVATGVYLDDVDQLIETETQKMEQTLYQQQLITFSIAGLAVLISIWIMVVFEKHIRRLITSYEDQIACYTKGLEKLSTTDTLTGLYNRLKLDEFFSYQLQHSRRYKNGFSVLMIDLDKFKHINDTYGHQVGDQVLQEMAKVFKQHIRSSDLVGRWGGEEFLIICPETQLDHAKLLAEKIRNAVATHHFSEVGRMTCSIGVSGFQEGDSKEQIIDHADKALYCAKENGRNQVKAYSHN